MIGKIIHAAKIRRPSRAGSRTDTNEIDEKDLAKKAT
jgi:hypothetical protein